MAAINLLVEEAAQVPRADADELLELLRGLTGYSLPVVWPGGDHVSGTSICQLLGWQLRSGSAPENPNLPDALTIPCTVPSRLHPLVASERWAPVRSIRWRSEMSEGAFAFTISGLMIVRDGLSAGSDCIRALRSLAPICHEIIVNDTGSVDGTIEELRALRACLPCPLHIIERDWEDDFALARNQAKALAQEAFVAWIDADEEYSEEACQQIIWALRHDVEDPPGRLFAYQLAEIGPGFAFPHWRPRVLPNRPDIAWRYELHEDTSESLLEAGARVLRLTGGIYHHSFGVEAHHELNARRDAPILARHPKLAEKGAPMGTEPVIVVHVKADGQIDVIESRGGPSAPALPDPFADMGQAMALGVQVPHLLDLLKSLPQSDGRLEPMELDFPLEPSEAEVRDAFHLPPEPA